MPGSESGRPRRRHEIAAHLRAPGDLIDEIVRRLDEIATVHGGRISRRIDPVTPGLPRAVLVVSFTSATGLRDFLDDPARADACDETGVALVWTSAPLPHPGPAGTPVRPLPVRRRDE